MGRRRNALWESPDTLVYIARHRRGFLVVDTRGVRTEKFRATLDDARRLADQLTVNPTDEPTFFDLALDYLENGTTVWHDGDEEVALTVNTVEDRKARLRNHFGEIGARPLSELPTHFIGDTVRRLRIAGRSKSLQDKVRTEALAVMKWGAARGLVPVDHDWVGPLRSVRTRRVDNTKLIGRFMRPLPRHRDIHRLAKLAARQTGAPYMRLFFWLLAYVGFREGELCAVRIDDVDIDTRVRIHVRRKAVWRSGSGVVIEDYAKGYVQRTVVVPRLLEAAVITRTREVRQAGGTLLFPKWGATRRTDEVIDYSGLRELFLRCGEQIGWTVLTRSATRTYTGADGRTRVYAGKPQSLEYSLHDLRAFAASRMHEPRRGLSLRGMGMTVHAVARQLGDHPETVKRHYLGIIDGAGDLLEREVP